MAEKYSMSIGALEVDPRKIRFTVESIPSYFDFPHGGRSLNEAVDLIHEEILEPEKVLPMMNVTLHRGIMWCLDNRRLWVLRKAGVSSVRVKIVQRNYSTISSNFIRNLDDDMMAKLSKFQFFPSVIGDHEGAINGRHQTQELDRQGSNSAKTVNKDEGQGCNSGKSRDTDGGQGSKSWKFYMQVTWKFIIKFFGLIQIRLGI